MYILWCTWSLYFTNSSKLKKRTIQESSCCNLVHIANAAVTGYPQGKKHPSNPTKNHENKLRSDMLIRGHFNWGINILLYIMVTNIDAKYHIRNNPVIILATNDKTKKNKDLDIWLKQRPHFTPFIFSTYSMIGCEATTLEIHLELKYFQKYQHIYYHVCGVT